MHCSAVDCSSSFLSLSHRLALCRCWDDFVFFHSWFDRFQSRFSYIFTVVSVPETSPKQFHSSFLKASWYPEVVLPAGVDKSLRISVNMVTKALLQYLMLLAPDPDFPELWARILQVLQVL